MDPMGSRGEFGNKKEKKGGEEGRGWEKTVAVPAKDASCKWPMSALARDGSAPPEMPRANG